MNQFELVKSKAGDATVVGMFDFAVFTKGRAEEADRITAVALNFEMKGKRFAFNGHQISTLTSINQDKNTKCMATNEILNGCGSSIEAVLALNQKRRRGFSYMKLLAAPIGLLINFHAVILKEGIYRMMSPEARS